MPSIFKDAFECLQEKNSLRRKVYHLCDVDFILLVERKYPLLLVREYIFYLEALKNIIYT